MRDTNTTLNTPTPAAPSTGLLSDPYREAYKKHNQDKNQIPLFHSPRAASGVMCHGTPRPRRDPVDDQPSLPPARDPGIRTYVGSDNGSQEIAMQAIQEVAMLVPQKLNPITPSRKRRRESSPSDVSINTSRKRSFSVLNPSSGRESQAMTVRRADSMDLTGDEAWHSAAEDSASGGTVTPHRVNSHHQVGSRFLSDLERLSSSRRDGYGTFKGSHPSASGASVADKMDVEAIRNLRPQSFPIHEVSLASEADIGAIETPCLHLSPTGKTLTPTEVNIEVIGKSRLPQHSYDVAMSEADEALGRDSGVVVVDNGSTDQARVDEMNVDALATNHLTNTAHSDSDILEKTSRGIQTEAAIDIHCHGCLCQHARKIGKQKRISYDADSESEVEYEAKGETYAHKHNTQNRKANKSWDQVYTPRHQTPAENRFKDDIHRAITQKYDFKEPYAIQTPLKDQVERFTKTGKEEDGPDLNTFLLDFDGNTMHTSWNERIVLLLANQYLEEEDPFTDDLPKVRHAFMQHLRTLHRNYQKRRAIQTDDDVIQEQQDQRRDNQSARQRKVRERREEAAIHYADLDPQMKDFQELW